MVDGSNGSFASGGDLKGEWGILRFMGKDRRADA
jgi:hypothetical protein